jgi:TadE-like protein
MAMKNKNTRLHKSKSERAQSLVEFAISLLLILTILTGAVEISLALFEYVTIRDAAQEGALYGSVNPNDTAGIRNRVIDAASDGLTLTAANVVVTINGGACEGITGGLANTIRITITRPHQVIMPLIGAFIGQQINMSANVTDTILSPSCS